MKQGAKNFLLAVWPLMLLLVSCSAPAPQRQPFTRQDIAGAWQANYSRYTLPDIGKLQRLLEEPPLIEMLQGFETIVLGPDGVFQQSFELEGELVSNTGTWEVEGSVAHLRGGKLYVYGLSAAENLAQGKVAYHTVDCDGREIELDLLSELMLCIRPDRKAPGGLVLQHLPVGDPDAPEVVTFYRLATAVTKRGSRR